MPCAPRQKGKATKIAYDIMGKPENMEDDKSRKDKKVDRMITWQNNTRVK